MKKLLVTLLVAATSVNFVACGSSNKGPYYLIHKLQSLQMLLLQVMLLIIFS